MSDQLFPNWIDSKAPWSLDQGGTGEAPEDARERVDPRTSQHPEWKRLRENQRRAFLALRANVPKKETFKGVEDARECADFVSCLVERTVTRTKELGSGDNKVLELHAIMDELKDEIQASLLALDLLNRKAED